LESDAGRELVRIIQQYYPRIPVIIASKAKEAYDFKDAAFILPKGDPGSLETLEEYIHDFTGMGDFLIQDNKEEELFRIKDIFQMNEVLSEAKKRTELSQRLREILEVYAARDAFSTWLYMHGFREIGDEIRPQRSRGTNLVRQLMEPIEREIARIHSTPLEVGEERVFSLADLLGALRKAEPELIQPLADNDIFSTWLDRKGYPELAEEIRPIHGSGEKLKAALILSVSKWVGLYKNKID
jgi:hypothetical protein